MKSKRSAIISRENGESIIYEMPNWLFKRITDGMVKARLNGFKMNMIYVMKIIPDKFKKLITRDKWIADKP